MFGASSCIEVAPSYLGDHRRLVSLDLVRDRVTFTVRARVRAGVGVGVRVGARARAGFGARASARVRD